MLYLLNPIRESPDFFNRVTVTFPAEPDERLAAYTGGRGSQYSYTVQAAPTISEDFIQERQTSYPNVRYSQAEVAGLLATQLKQVEGGENLENYIRHRQDILEAIHDDTTQIEHNFETGLPGGGNVTQDLNGALNDVQERISRVLERLGPLYVRPKYQTVAHNLLNESLRYMYSGELVQLQAAEDGQTGEAAVPASGRVAEK